MGDKFKQNGLLGQELEILLTKTSTLKFLREGRGLNTIHSPQFQIKVTKNIVAFLQIHHQKLLNALQPTYA